MAKKKMGKSLRTTGGIGLNVNRQREMSRQRTMPDSGCSISEGDGLSCSRTILRNELRRCFCRSSKCR